MHFILSLVKNNNDFLNKSKFFLKIQIFIL
jgi:hypothetical protein